MIWWSQLIPIHGYRFCPPLSNPVFSDVLLVVWNPIFTSWKFADNKLMLLSPLETLFYPAVCCTLPNYSSEEDDCSIEPWEWWSEILSRNFSSKYIMLVFVTEWAVRHFTARELPLTGIQHLSCVPHKAHFMETVSMFMHSKQDCVSTPGTCPSPLNFSQTLGWKEDSANPVVKSSGTGYTGHG